MFRYENIFPIIGKRDLGWYFNGVPAVEITRTDGEREWDSIVTIDGDIIPESLEHFPPLRNTPYNRHLIASGDYDAY